MNAAPNYKTVEIKAFVPARDIALSKQFYTDLGFTMAWNDDSMAYLYAGNTPFLLQKFYVKEHAENFMMHMLVEDVEAWWARVVERDMAARYGVRAIPPADQHWGIRDFCIDDPTGVLWRIGTNLDVPGGAPSTNEHD